MERAERRHRAERAKARARTYYDGWHMRSSLPPAARERLLGIYARTPKVCSRWCCGNPRRTFFKRTLAERRAKLSAAEQL